MSCLVVISGSTKGRTFQVSPDRDNVVGRVSDCDVCIVDTRISRRHCVISAGEAGYLIKDLGSANGILVNGVKASEATLADGDKIRLGVTELEFHQTERFEDAETKRLAPGEQMPPDLQRSARKPAKSPATQSLEFCARCSGSIPAADLVAGRARKVDGKSVCTECLAHERAKADAAAALAPRREKAQEQAEDAREKTSAEEVSQLAVELAEQAPSPLEEDAAPEPPSAEESAEPEEASPAEDEDAVPVEVEDQDDELNTDALVIPEGTFDEPEPAEDAPEPEEEKEADPPKAKPVKAKAPKAKAAKAKPVKAKPAGPEADETAPLDVAEVIEKAKQAEKAEKLSAADLYDEALLEPEEVIELDDDGLPKLPDEKDIASLDEDSKTPRPGSEIRVL